MLLYEKLDNIERQRKEAKRAAKEMRDRMNAGVVPPPTQSLPGNDNKIVSLSDEISKGVSKKPIKFAFAVKKQKK